MFREQYNYICTECGCLFDTPAITVENQAPCPGLWWPERMKVCPNCSSPAYEPTYLHRKTTSMDEDS